MNSSCDIESLTRALTDEDKFVRWHAARDLENLGPAAANAVPVLIRVLEKRDDIYFVVKVAEALAKTGRAIEAVPVLTQMLVSERTEVRGAAARVLGEVGPPAAEAVPALIRMLRSLLNDDRIDAARALGGIGPAAAEAVPTLIGLLGHRHPEDGCIATVAAYALRSIQPDAVPEEVSNLIRAWEEKEEGFFIFSDEISQSGDDTLGRSGATDWDQPVVSALGQDVDHDPVAPVCVDAIGAVEKIHSGYPPASAPAFSSLDLSVPIVARRRDSRKRDPAETEKSLLALLDACLDWPHDTVSVRKLHASTLLHQKRKQLGLTDKSTPATVTYHLQALAKLCRVESLLMTDAQRQYSCFRPGVKELLRQVARPLLEECIGNILRRFDD